MGSDFPISGQIPYMQIFYNSRTKCGYEMKLGSYTNRKKRNMDQKNLTTTAIVNVTVDLPISTVLGAFTGRGGIFAIVCTPPFLEWVEPPTKF